MSFGEHLEELRTRLWRALIVPIPLAIAFFFLAPYFREVLIAPLFAALRANGQTSQIQALSPAETITTDMKLAVIAAVAVSAPWLIYQLWLFVSPGLYLHERRYARFLTPLSAVMTFLGIALFYWVLLPFSLLFLVGFGAAKPRSVPMPAAQVAPDGTPSVPEAPKPFAFELREQDPESPTPGQAWVSTTDQVLRIAVPMRNPAPNALIATVTEASESLVGPTAPTEPQLSILEIPLTVLGGISQLYRLSEYISFTLLLLAGTVIAFQMPLVVLLLGWVGIVSPEFLRSKRRMAVFIMAIVAAVVTPSSDPGTMLMMLLPLWALYEFGILLLVFVPSHRVAQGRVFSFRRGRDEPDESDGGWGGSSR
ncbi:MAG: Sec-independent protein translocase protein TatC [Planctomycetota bacterium]|jgi:Sec-independent protein secretion pathway component TatC